MKMKHEKNVEILKEIEEIKNKNKID